MTFKGRAPNNRTLVLDDSEVPVLSNELLTLKEFATVEQLTNRIVHQDLFDIAECILPYRFVDLLIVDPPYNRNKLYGNTKFPKTARQEYSDWFEWWLVQIRRCLKPTASIYVCSDWSTSCIVQPLLEYYFKLRNRITWEREKGRGAERNWKNNSEDIWFCTVSDDYTFDPDIVKVKRRVVAPYRDSEGKPKDWKDGFRMTYSSNLWTDISVPFWSMSENTDHPTQKPEKLIAKLILASSHQDDFIFDPFVARHDMRRR
jgi:site-specific DNA-methyltransferase (adenine-specific)